MMLGRMLVGMPRGILDNGDGRTRFQFCRLMDHKLLCHEMVVCRITHEEFIDGILRCKGRGNVTTCFPASLNNVE